MSLALRPVLVCGAMLAPLWGLALPHYLLLDALALEAARPGGFLAGLAVVSATLGAWFLRRRLGPERAPHRSALDLGVLATVGVMAHWAQLGADGRVPYLEGFALAMLDVSAGWACALAAYVLIARRRRQQAPAGPAIAPAESADRPVAHPSMRAVFVATVLCLSVAAAVLLGVGSVGRAAGARGRQLVEQTAALADLGSRVLERLPAEGDHARRRLLDILTTHGDVWVALLPPDVPPDLLAAPGTRSSPVGADGYIALTSAGRFHFLRRPLGEDVAADVLWLRADLGQIGAVLTPDDAPGLLLLALLVLVAPAAAGVIGREVATDLRALTMTLSRAAEAGTAVATVPVRGNDDIGDLAATLNTTLRAREAENARLAAELEGAAATDRARSRFLAGASHELRTPLNAITGYCHLLRGETLAEAQREDVALIEEAGLQLLAHVDEILDLSRIEAGKDAPLERRPTDLVVLVQQVCQARAPDAGRDVTLTMQAAPDVPVLSVDPLRLRQTLENLVGNALKFTRRGQVQVTIAPEAGGGVHIQVADTGPGIPADELESIFSEFHRVEGQRQVAGTGLGLAIARRFVTQHDGRLYAESVQGQGSVFHLHLPGPHAGPNGAGA
jgi:signal transduction histidine kinase